MAGESEPKGGGEIRSCLVRNKTQVRGTEGATNNSCSLSQKIQVAQ
jgi:hypothetical protein